MLTVTAYSCGGSGATGPTSSPAPSAAPTTVEPSASNGAPGGPEFDAALALDDIRALSVDIGIRAAGTDGEKRAANYIRDQLASYGYAVSLQPFPVQSVIDIGTTLGVIAPQQQTIPALALQASGNGTVQTNVVLAGLGRTGDFPPDTSGKIALVQRGEITFGDKVANAAAAGAVGVIIYNDQPGPFAGQIRTVAAIPAVSISQEDGQALARTLAGGPVTARLTVQTRTETRQSQNVLAERPGGNCRVVAGGHYDSVPAGPGANDNASGTAVVMEMARVLAATGKSDGVCFALFGAEEIGLVGSEHYVQSLSAGEKRGIKGMLNFDMLAVGDDWPLEGADSLVQTAAQEAQKLSFSHSIFASLPGNASSDHGSFLEAGIPAILFNCFCDEHYHTADDRIEFIQEKRLGEAGALGLAMVADLLRN